MRSARWPSGCGAWCLCFCLFGGVDFAFASAKVLRRSWRTREFTGVTASPLIEEELLILYIRGKPAACVVAFHKNSPGEPEPVIPPCSLTVMLAL